MLFLPRPLFVMKAEKEATPTEEPEPFEPGCVTSTTTVCFEIGPEALSELSCLQCPLNAESQVILLNDINSQPVSHPGVASCHQQKKLDASFGADPSKWCGDLSTENVALAGTLFSSDVGSVVQSTDVQCTVDVKTTPSTNGKKRFSCHLCPYTSIHKSNVTKHIRTHTRERPFMCNICSVTFATNGNLKRHSETHTERKNYKCDVCAAGPLKSRTEALLHMHSHSGQVPFRCNSCSREFTFRSQLDRHMRIHTGDKPHKCDYCSLSFRQKAHLVAHMRRHTGEKPFVCDVCSRGFTTKTGLVYHLVMHKQKKPYKCPTCSRLFARKTSMVHHMKMHHT